MWWLLLITLLVLFGIYLLFAPLELFVDTKDHTYFIAMKGLARVSIIPDRLEVVRVRLRVAFMNFNFYPLRRTKPSKKKRIPQEGKTRKARKIGPKRMVRLLSSFCIKSLYLNLDTGDVVLNAKLYPIATFLNHHVGGFNINFQGKNRMVLRASNRPINIIKVFINT